jgi:hypothetical protein
MTQPPEFSLMLTPRFSRPPDETVIGMPRLVVEHEIFFSGDTGCYGNRDGKQILWFKKSLHHLNAMSTVYFGIPILAYYGYTWLDHRFNVH